MNKNNIPEYRLLKSINYRCDNQKCNIYKWYGGRGIKNELTLEDIQFLMKRDNYHNLKRPSIERKNSKLNYTLDNCEFIDRGENTVRRNIQHSSKVMIQLDLENKFIKEWQSTREIERILGFAHANTSRVANGKQKQAYGYLWKYK
jgi:hypothetical protein